VTTACSLYSHRYPSVIIEKHHIVPKSWFEAAGKPVDTPMADICPNCHMNVHSGIDWLIGHGGAGDSKGIPKRCMQLALQAMTLATQKGLTPARTL